MGRKRLKKLVSREDFRDNPTWWVAEKYDIEEVQDKDGRRMDQVVAKRAGMYAAFYYPLRDPKLFSSFARLGGRKYVSDNDILRWVRKYGLLERRDERKPYFVIDPDEKEPYGPWDTSFLEPPDGLSGRRRLVPNQAPISVRDFRAEVTNAHSVSILYSRMRGDGLDGIKSLKGRILDLYERQDGAPGTLSEIDRGLLERWGGRVHESGARYREDDDALWNDATRALEMQVRRKISKVGLDFAGDNLAVRGAPPWPLTHSQSFYCPDLISAIYLQFYFLITGALPVRICANENCRGAFELTRKDRVYCGAGCRSSARPSRRKRSL